MPAISRFTHELSIAETTVNFHVKNLADKLGANDSIHAGDHSSPACRRQVGQTGPPIALLRTVLEFSGITHKLFIEARAFCDGSCPCSRFVWLRGGTTLGGGSREASTARQV
jgi:hypothetical protein